ncbi:MAG: DUF4270 family protein [Bacteroidales bacterium]|nr:DUF4270 family protein [Bacteroidales bacterium]
MVKRRISFRRVLSSFHRIVAYQFFVTLIAIALSLSSCYNEPEFIGKNLIPTSDLKSVKIDTSFKVSAYTVKTDSIPTGVYSTAVLGCYNSKIFGRTKSDFLVQLLIMKTTDTILKKMSPRPEPDSLILYVPLSRSWGTKNKEINIKVFELKDTLNYSIYYNGLEKTLDGKYYPTQINMPTIYKGEDTLKIRFTNEFARKLINADTTILTSNTQFLKFMRGLYITSDEYSGSDGVLYFFKNGMLMRLFYNSHQGGVKHDTLFTYGTGSGRYNHFIHNFDSAEPDFKIKNLDDTTHQDTVFYISGLGGARGLIKLDGFGEWAKKMPIAINRAELRVDIQEDISKDSIISPLLYYYNRDNDTSSIKGYRATSTNDVINLYDYSLTQIQSSKYYKPKHYYSIDITFHLQNLLKGKIKRNYFYLEPSDFKVNYKEGIFRTGKSSNRMKLIITYSKL